MFLFLHRCLSIYTVSTAIRRALWARDGGCAFPGCAVTRFVEAHHIQHWSVGGETSVDNCCLLCSHHHKLVHEGGFTVTRASLLQCQQPNASRLIFKRPDGRVIPSFGYRTSDWQDENVEAGVDASVEEAAATYCVSDRAFDDDCGFNSSDQALLNLFPRKQSITFGRHLAFV